jgi:hypothetical protein
VHHIRTFLLGDEIASLVFGQAGIHQGQDLGVLALGVELLQFRSQSGALGCGGGEGDAIENRKRAMVLSSSEPLIPGDLGLS